MRILSLNVEPSESKVYWWVWSLLVVFELLTLLSGYPPADLFKYTTSTLRKEI